MERVLIVDDDPDIQRLVSYNLSQAGFQVLSASTGRTALDTVQEQPPDLIILDIMMPDVDGLEVCRTLRQREDSRRIPIIMLTARSEEIDRVVGFELGADDYVMKPFSPRELVLRVKSIFRRVKDDRSDFLRVLHELMRARGNVLTREFLMDKVWGYHGEATSRTLDTHVRRLREKLRDDGELVETVRSVGYRIVQGADG
jgi:two-component system, OmpR family, phosphate regulon response regulator PhoB